MNNIEYLLKDRLPGHYGLNPDGVTVSVSHRQAPFTEVDAKACREAAEKDYAYKSYSAAQPMIAQRGSNNAERNMLAMFTTASSVSGRIVTENIVMKHRFTFVQNRYPTVYEW